MSFKQLLKKKNLTQDKVIEKMRKLKFYKYQQQVSDWVNGVRLPDLTSVYYLAQVLGVSMEEITEACFRSYRERWGY